VMPAHQSAAYDDRGWSCRPLQISRQTVPHGNESRSSSEGCAASLEQALRRPHRN
jgi:hypothetical protein